MDRFCNFFVIEKKNEMPIACYTGQVVLLKCFGEEMEAAFVCYNQLSKMYTFHLNHWKHDHDIGMPMEDLQKQLIKIYPNIISPYVRCPTTRRPKDSEIDGLPLAWMWYIFLMAMSTIFKDNVGLWILFSVAFFWHRYEKKKGLVHVDWYFFREGDNREYNEKIHGADYYKPYFDWKAAQKEEGRKRLEKYMRKY